MQAFLSSASPLCFMQADRSAELGGRAAAAGAAVKRCTAVLSDHSYPSSKSSLQANHMELSRPTPRSTSSTQQLHTCHGREQQDDGVCCDSGFMCLMEGWKRKWTWIFFLHVCLHVQTDSGNKTCEWRTFIAADPFRPAEETTSAVTGWWPWGVVASQ